MHWKMKYALQRTFSLLPGQYGPELNGFVSRRFGGLKVGKNYDVANTIGMCGLLRHLDFKIAGKDFVELGSGWGGGSALVLLSLGARAIRSYDLFRHFEPRYREIAKSTLDQQRVKWTSTFPFPGDFEAVVADCASSSIDWDQYHYHAPHDARSTNLPTDTVDCYFSSAVLEHVSAVVLPAILAESYRILEKGGLCFHYIQPTMHAAWSDSKATGVDYLTVPDWEWELFLDNDVAHENRLRGPEHVELIRNAGFKIEGVWKTVDNRALAALKVKTVSPRFRRFSPEELATDYVWIVGRKE